MTPDLLMKYFDRIVDAPDAIPRLRRFVIDLAVRGKLLQQNVEDEPAPELLNRIRAEKERSVKLGITTPTETQRLARDAELPWPLPLGWAVSSLQSICLSVTDGDHLPPPKAKDGIPFLVIGNVREGVLNFANCRFVSREYYDDLAEIRRPQKGDILYTLVGSYGIPVMLRDDSRFCVQRHIGILRPSGAMCAEYLCRVLESGWVFDQATNCATGIAQKTVPLSGLRRMIIPLPPFAEQHRIAVRVSELMALCDRLESAKAELEDRRNTLVAATNHHVTSGDDPPSFRRHARFYCEHFPRLAVRTENVERLRQTLLSLAFTGKLSKQSVDDGSGHDLVDRLRASRSMTRKRKPLDTAEPTVMLPRLPKTWTWSTIGNVAHVGDNAITDGPFGANLKTADYVDTPGYRVVRLQNIARFKFREEHRSYIDKARFHRLAKHQVFPGDLVVAGLVDPLIRCCAVPHDLGPAIVKADCYRFKVHPSFSTRFALYYLNSPLCQALAAVHHHGMTLVRIGLGNFRLIPVPVPPLAEQDRIVARVDTLMKLCDELEGRITSHEEVSRQLLEAVLSKALEFTDISEGRGFDVDRKTDNLCPEEGKLHERTIRRR